MGTYNRQWFHRCDPLHRRKRLLLAVPESSKHSTPFLPFPPDGVINKSGPSAVDALAAIPAVQIPCDLLTQHHSSRRQHMLA